MPPRRQARVLINHYNGRPSQDLGSVEYVVDLLVLQKAVGMYACPRGIESPAQKGVLGGIS